MYGVVSAVQRKWFGGTEADGTDGSGRITFLLKPTIWLWIGTGGKGTEADGRVFGGNGQERDRF